MNKFNIFIFNVNTAPMEGLEQEESVRIMQGFVNYFDRTFDDKYEEGNWGAEGAMNVRSGGSSHMYFILPEIEPVETTKTFIAETMKLSMPDNFKVLSSEVQHIRMANSVKEGKQIVRAIIDVLLNQPKNVH